MKIKKDTELLSVLKLIASYKSTAWLKKNAPKAYGLSYQEALEFAYENIRAEAKVAVGNKK